MPVTVYMQNMGGLNLTDSPLMMQDNQATGQSFNYDYIKTGSISKVLGSLLLNAIADTQLKTLGLGQYHSASDDSRALIRAAGTKIQTYDVTTGDITNIESDTSTPTTDFLGSSSTQPVVFAPFNTDGGGTQVWMAGGGMSTLYAYTGSKVTATGVADLTGLISTSVNTMAGGVFVAPGTFYYAVQFHKSSTDVVGNVALDASATTVNTTDTVTIDLSSIANLDSTKYDKIDIFRSAISGVSGFTTGSLIAQLSSTTTSYTDTGTSIADAQNIPRNGNTILDNSQLPTGSYKYISTFKRRLVTASNSTIYISDLDKPESFPLTNVITVPSGGPITGLGTIGVPSEYTTGADEYLCIWKDSELWVLTGDGPDTWDLMFVDKTGAAGQSLVVPFNGFVTWIGYNGIYIWDGRGRPARVSRPIGAIFESDGDLDKSMLAQGYAAHYEKGNQIIFRVSHRTKGTNRLSIKMDTRLTSLAAGQNLQNPEIDGVFSFDTDNNSYYSVCSFKPSNFDEVLAAGDDVGFVYRMFDSSSTTVEFTYETKPLDMGNPATLKHFKRVVAYIEKLTPNDLKLHYWSDYRIRDEYASEVSATMTPTKSTQPALWDIALFDLAMFDDYYPDISPLEFNLHSSENNTTGLSLKLRFEQLEAAAPVRIHGFAIEWESAEELTTPYQQVT